MTGGRKATATAKPHPFAPDVDTPGTCSRCRLIRANAAHDRQAVAELQAAEHQAQDEHRRRLGERED
jgi:hypothetical protein